MGKTSIEWTRGEDGSLGRTWNPVRGCSRVSDGCRNCYAERMAARFSRPGMWGNGFASMRGVGKPVPGKRSPLSARWTGRVELIEEKLREPLSWRAPSRVFVNSTSDLFHEALPDEAIDRAFAVMALCPQHTMQTLTKRAERAREYLSGAGRMSAINDAAREAGLIGSDRAIFPTQMHGMVPGPGWPLPNVWLGVSVEDQATADERIPLLLQTPAAVRFVSAEPLLRPVDFGPHWMDRDRYGANCYDGSSTLDWIIVGGESGPGARPCNVEWIRSIVEQTKAAGLPCFVKQVGAVPWAPNDRIYLDFDPASWPEDTAIEDPATRATHQGEPCRIYLRDRKGGDPAEWPDDLRVREFPKEKQ